MELEEALVGHLAADATLGGLLGVPPGMRLYPDQAPPSAELPYVCYSQASRERRRTLASHPHHLTPGTVNLPAVSMRLDVYASSAPSRRAVVRALGKRLEGFQGFMGAGLSVQGVFHEDDDGGSETPAHADEMGEYTAGIDLRIHYAEVS